MFAPVSYVRWRGRILYVLSSLIGMSSISSSECPIKRKVERGCFEAIGSTQSSLSLYSPARDPHSGLRYGIIRSKGSSDRGAYTEDRSRKSLEVEDKVIEGHTLKIEASVL